MINIRNRREGQSQPLPAVPDDQKASDEPPRMSLGDEIRQRVAARRRGDALPELPEVGSPFFLFSKGDLMVLLIILAVIYVVVRVEHNVDLAHVVWSRFLRPHYDADHWDA
jgi:hypothetical protein